MLESDYWHEKEIFVFADALWDINGIVLHYGNEIVCLLTEAE